MPVAPTTYPQQFPGYDNWVLQMLQQYGYNPLTGANSGNTPTPTPAPTPTPVKTPEQIKAEEQARLMEARQAEIRRFIQSASPYMQARGVSMSPEYRSGLGRLSEAELAGIRDPEMMQGALTPDLVNRYLDLQEQALRSRAVNRVEQNMGVNYSTQAVDDNFLDDYIQQILGDQRTQAEDYLERGRARGIYNDVGMQEGQRQLSNFASAGQSNLNNLARGVLDSYQSRLDGVRNQAFTAANSVNLSQGNFNFNDYLQRGNQIAEEARNNAQGDLTSALGGTNFFDFSELNNRAGRAQGALNLRDTDLATAVRERKSRDSAQRGIGNTGVF